MGIQSVICVKLDIISKKQRYRKNLQTNIPVALMKTISNRSL